mgnify:CR=1 FL=1
MSHEELIQVVDEFTGEPIGISVPRSELFAKNLWCRSTNIFVLNSEGQILCHQRSLNKERYPGVWSTHFGGHVSDGESFRINAVKEVEEEIGLPVHMFQMVPWRTSRKTQQRIWMRDFITVYNGPVEKLELQESEIKQVRFMAPNEILETITDKSLGYEWGELAGAYNFREDYQCLRAVLTACLDAGIFNTNYHELSKWAPISEEIKTIA